MKIHTRWKRLLLLFLAVALVTAACGSDDDESATSSDEASGSGGDGETVKVGILHSLSPNPPIELGMNA